MTGTSEPLAAVTCVRADITTLGVDGIVNAANAALRGGGGVDGAVHAAAGPGLLEELRRRYPRGGETGGVYETAGYDLPARHVLHAVGPVWRGGGDGEPAALASCYARSVRIASDLGLRSLAFPAISCGVYGYPHVEAADVALDALADALPGSGLEDVRFALFSADLLDVFARALAGARE